MKKLPVIFLAFFAVLVSSVGFAQDKIEERSAKKSPAWIGISVPEYVIVSAEGNSLEFAKQGCMENIKQSIVNAVSMNICSQEVSEEQQVESVGSSEIYKSYESEIKTVAGRLPFITGISLSDAEIYWEKRLVKKEKRSYYVSHAKYPFPLVRRNALIAEFLRQDRAQYNKYLELKQNFDTFTQIEYIDRAITELEPLIAYFFDDMRRNEVKSLQQNYRKLYTMISAVPYENSLGEHLFYLSLNNRRVTTSRAPRIKSAYATDVRVVAVGESMYSVKYNYEQCLDEDDNSIELIYLIGGQALKHRFLFDIREEKVAVIPCGRIEIELNPMPNSADSCARINATMDLRSKYEVPFEVTNIDLAVEGIKTHINGALSSKFEGKGIHRLYFQIEGPFATSDRRSALAQGIVTLRNLKTGKQENLRIALPYAIKIQ